MKVLPGEGGTEGESRSFLTFLKEACGKPKRHRCGASFEAQMLIAFCQERGGFVHKLQLGEAQRKCAAHTARAAGVKVACFVNLAMRVVRRLGSRRPSIIKSLL